MISLALWYQSLISRFLSLQFILIVKVCCNLHRYCHCYVPTWRTHTDPSQEMSRTVTSPVPFFHGCGSPQGRYCHSDTLTTAVVICIYISANIVSIPASFWLGICKQYHTPAYWFVKWALCFKGCSLLSDPAHGLQRCRRSDTAACPLTTLTHPYWCFITNALMREREIWESLWRWNMAVHSEWNSMHAEQDVVYSAYEKSV